jgi:hypothetical protein
MATPAAHAAIHFVFSSHWDREWYLPFQKYRAKLVRALDVIVDELESGRLPHFQLDGQFIPVEDYLEVRPEKEKLVKRLIGEGKLVVGPWYNLPDLFLVSGESLVRNLQMGMARALKCGGKVSKVGWMCDLFGHNSQMPQILRQFGIANAFLWRGAEVELGRQFLWRSSDGSEVFVHRFTDAGYGDFAHVVRKGHLRGVEMRIEDLVADMEGAIAKSRKATPSETLLLFDGGDHQEFDPRMLELMRACNERGEGDLIRVSTLDAFMKEVLAEKLGGLKSVEGELRAPGSARDGAHLIPGVGSSRIPIKRANHAGETQLTLWLEPWAAVAAECYGWETPPRAVELAWEYLLKNHPHDSICGCSPDETHEDMPYRFAQARKIAEVYLQEIFETVAANELSGKLQEKELALSLFAPAGGTRRRVVEVEVKLPADWPAFNEFFGYEGKPSLQIFNQEGQEIPYQLLAVKPHTLHYVVPRFKFPAAEGRKGVRLALDLEMDPLENVNLILRRCEGPTRISQAGSIGVAANRLRNQFLDAQVKENGTLSLTDAVSGETWHDLLLLEDTADIGDGWFHGVALQDRSYLSSGGNVAIGLLENGPLLARLHVRVEFMAPASFDFAEMKRSSELRPLVVEHRITLRKGAKSLEIETTIDNQIRDHRLRLLCSSGFRDASSFWSDTPFDAVERAVQLRNDNHLLKELQVEMTPQQNWVAVSNGKTGLALIAPGQYESAVLDQPDRPIALTLLRGFRKAVLTDGNEGGQILGRHTIRLALRPFQVEEGRIPAAMLQQEAQSVAAPVQAIYQDFLDLKEGAWRLCESPRGHPPLLDLGEGAVLTSCRRTEEGEWQLRIYNPGTQDARVGLPDGFSWKRVNLLGEEQEKLRGAWNLGAKTIATLVGVATPAGARA